MTEQTETKNEREIRIGPDRVTVTDNEVVIEARHEMPEWEVRTLNAPATFFEGKKYLLVEKGEARSPYSIRYVLRAWPEGKIANAKQFHTYDAEAVAERDSSRRGEVWNEVVWICLLPLYPFLGLLWSGAQQRLVRFGYVPRTITGLSIFTCFGVVLIQGVFVVVTINASMRLGKMMVGGILRAMMGQVSLHVGSVSIPVSILDGLLALAFLADLGIRYSHYLRDDQWTGGFLEWLMPQSLRRKI